MEGERETREEVKCNRGFIVCGSLGRERSERRRERQQDEGEETGEGGRQWEQCVGRDQDVRAALLSQPADRGPPDQISSAVIRLMLLRRRPAQWKSNSHGTRLKTPL